MTDSDALHRRARAFVRAFEAGAPPPEPFDDLACDLGRFQAAHVEGYARLCAARGVNPRDARRPGELPAVPTDVFKLARVATFPEAHTAVTFRTSGTTVGQRGAHAVRDVGTYDVAALAFGREALAYGLGTRVPVVALTVAPSQAPDSSLVHMIDAFARAFGTPATARETYVLDADGVLDLDTFDQRVSRALFDGTETMLVLGTSFAFVHLLDALGDDTFRLPPGSRVMQTGGFKGRSREVAPETLRRDLARAFAIPERSIVAEYGMTELSSQFYEWTARDREARHGVYREPPWARVVPVDPETLQPVAEGDVGIARIEDLMNVDSAFAVLAADRVRRVPGEPGSFELLGRAPGAAPRGCSLSVEEMLERRPSVRDPS